MKRPAWTIAAFFPLIGMIGCQRGAPPTSGTVSQPVATAKTSTELAVQPKGDAKKSDPVPDAMETAARSFLQTLVSGDIRAAVERTAIDFRKRVSGPLTFEEERKLGFSNGDTAEFLGHCRGNSQGFQLGRRRRASDGQGLWVRGTLGGDGPTRPFTLRLINEDGNWRVAWFFAAAIPDPASPPEAADPESAWAAETLIDFLFLVLGSEPDYRLTMSLMTEDFKASLPSPSVADPGLKYAKRDVRNWLNNLRAQRSAFGIDSVVGTPMQVTVRGRFLGQDAAEFEANLVKDGQNWKINGFQVAAAKAPGN